MSGGEERTDRAIEAALRELESSGADDPTPMCEQTEYCELWFDIDKTTAEARVSMSVD